MNWEGQDRRKFLRADFPCKIVVGSPIRLLVSHTENISEGGIRVFLEEKLSAYTNVSMEIFFEKDRPIKCKGKIMWVVERINPIEKKAILFDTGIRFFEINDSDKQYIRQLVEKIVEKNNQENKEA